MIKKCFPILYADVLSKEWCPFPFEFCEFLFVICLSACTIGVLFRKSSLVPMSSKQIPTFSSYQIQCNCFMLRSFIHWALILFCLVQKPEISSYLSTAQPETGNIQVRKVQWYWFIFSFLLIILPFLRSNLMSTQYQSQEWLVLLGALRVLL